MKLKELETSLEKHRTICYKKDGNSITYHNKDMRQVEGNVYCGEPKAESQWNSYCMLYVLYPEQKVAMEIGAVNADYDTAEAANVATRNGIETQDAFINTIKRKIEAQEHIQLSWIEYLKYIRPTLIDACWESRKAFADTIKSILEKQRLNFQNHLLVAAQDIDLTVGLMCYIQLSLLGVAAYIKIDDAISKPMAVDDTLENYWFTPMYFSEVWKTRRMIKQVEQLFKEDK